MSIYEEESATAVQHLEGVLGGGVTQVSSFNGRLTSHHTRFPSIPACEAENLIAARLSPFEQGYAFCGVPPVRSHPNFRHTELDSAASPPAETRPYEPKARICCGPLGTLYLVR